MYAINLSDLDSLRTPGPINMAALLLGDFIPRSGRPETVCIDRGRFDTDAVILTGPAGSDVKRCQALVAFLQTVLGPRKLHRRVRCYAQGSHGGWREIVPAKERRTKIEMEGDDED